MKKCDSCDEESVWIVFASYTIDDAEAHPVHARYPVPMFRTCQEHLSILIAVDATSKMSTRQWLVKAAR